MRSRLLRYSLILAAVPVASIFLALFLYKTGKAPLTFVLTGTLIQIPIVLLCKNSVSFAIRPYAPVLLHMNVQRIPAPYEPDKYKTDAKVCAVGLWLGLLTPVFACLAVMFPKTLEITVLNFARYTAPNMTLMGLAALCAFAGSVALALWVEFSRVNVIYSEPGENKRYLYRGFAEEADDRKRMRAYLTQLAYYEKQEIK